jgi:hypothetical protein
MYGTNFASSHAIVRDAMKSYLAPMISREIAPMISREVEARLQRERTAPAVKARKAEPIQKIIDAAARRYWKLHPEKKAKPSHTARMILPQVKLAVADLPELPPRWREIIQKEKDEKKLEDVIRKRLPRP